MDFTDYSKELFTSQIVTFSRWAPMCNLDYAKTKNVSLHDPNSLKLTNVQQYLIEIHQILTRSENKLGKHLYKITELN
jgi:hypothetical protein